MFEIISERYRSGICVINIVKDAEGFEWFELNSTLSPSLSSCIDHSNLTSEEKEIVKDVLGLVGTFEGSI